MSDLRFEPTMARDDRSARAIYEEVRANPARRGFGFGARAAVVNVDFQQAYTRPDLFPVSAYVTDPDQIAHVNRISDAAREAGLPVVWTRVCYKPDGGDAGIWGTRTDTPDSLARIATPLIRASESTVTSIWFSTNGCRRRSMRRRCKAT